MTDRLNALTVVLDHDIREDDAESLIKAIAILKGVQQVTSHVADLESHVAYSRARQELSSALWTVLWPEAKSS